MSIGDNSNGTIHIASETDEITAYGTTNMPYKDFYYICNARDNLDFLLPPAQDY
jgi:hypothetical protein